MSRISRKSGVSQMMHNQTKKVSIWSVLLVGAGFAFLIYGIIGNLEPTKRVTHKIKESIVSIKTISLLLALIRTIGNWLSNPLHWIIVIAVVIAFLILRFFIRQARERKREFEAELNELRNKTCNTVISIEIAKQKLDKLKENRPKLAKKLHSDITALEQAFKNRKKHLELITIKKQAAHEKAERKRQKKISVIWRLINYFHEKKSDDAIPDWAEHIPKDIIERTRREYVRQVMEKAIRERENEIKEEKWQEAKEFVLKHQAYPSNFSEKKKEDKKIYRKAMKLMKEGKLQIEAKEEKLEILDEDKKLVSKRFYHADELEPEQREKLKRYGYKDKPFIFLDGSSGNNLIIKNDGVSESDYHFCLKHLFAEINECAEVEYQIGNFRADVAFIGEEEKIAVEIETGANKEIQVSNKVKWLNQHFDKWVFVCSRANKSKYSKYVDNKKSFCLTLKQANEKIQELLMELS